jgi:hypothetical protein
VPTAGGGSIIATYQGQVSGAAITGTLTVGQVSESINGQVSADGSVAGTIAMPAGQRVGQFTAHVVGSDVQVSYTLNGQPGQWTVPGTQVPPALKQLMSSTVSSQPLPSGQ